MNVTSMIGLDPTVADNIVMKWRNLSSLARSIEFCEIKQVLRDQSISGCEIDRVL